MITFVCWLLLGATVTGLFAAGFGWVAAWVIAGTATVMLLSLIGTRLFLWDSWVELPVWSRFFWVTRMMLIAPFRGFGSVLVWPLAFIVGVSGVLAVRGLAKRDSVRSWEMSMKGASLAGAVHENSRTLWERIMKADIATVWENDFFYPRYGEKAPTGVGFR